MRIPLCPPWVKVGLLACWNRSGRWCMRRAPRFSRSACAFEDARSWLLGIMLLYWHRSSRGGTLRSLARSISSSTLGLYYLFLLMLYRICSHGSRLDRSAFGKIEEATKGSVETWILSAVVGPFFIQDSMGKPAAPSDMPKPLRVTPAPQQKGDSLALPMSSGDQLGHPVHGIFKGQSVRNLEHSLRLGVAAAFAGSISVCR